VASTGGQDILGRQVSASGVAAGTQTEVSRAGVGVDNYADIAWNATTRRFSVGFVRGGHVEVAFLASGGGWLGQRTVSGWGPVYRVALATDGRDALVVFDFGWPGQSLMMGALANSKTMAVQSPFTISGPAHAQAIPAVAYNGQYVVIWEDERYPSHGGAELWATRVDRNGTVRDPGGFLITEYDVYDLQPALTWAGSTPRSFGLAWTACPYESACEIIGYGLRTDA
jgi:hypothetical protein